MADTPDYRVIFGTNTYDLSLLPGKGFGRPHNYMQITDKGYVSHRYVYRKFIYFRVALTSPYATKGKACGEPHRIKAREVIYPSPANNA